MRGSAGDHASPKSFPLLTVRQAARRRIRIRSVANQNASFGFVLFNDSKENIVEESTAHGNPWADAADYNVAANTWRDNSFGLTFFP